MFSSKTITYQEDLYWTILHLVQNIGRPFALLQGKIMPHGPFSIWGHKRQRRNIAEGILPKGYLRFLGEGGEVTGRASPVVMRFNVDLLL